MGSVGCDGEDEFQLCTSISMKHKIPGKFLDECGIVPRKIRSATKKRGHGSISLPLPSSRKPNHVSSGVDLRRKVGSKKSKLKMKREHVSKDEEEVAETLFALASIVPDTTKTKKLGLDGETSEAKSSSLQKAKSSEPVPKDVAISTPREASKKISTRVTVEAANCSSNLTESTVQVVKFHPSGDATQSNLPFNKESSTTSASGVQLNPSLVPISFSTKLPAWFDQTNNATRPRPCEEGVANEKLTSQDSQVPLESKNSWKKCCAHVYITRLIKVLQLPERKDGSQEKPKPANSSQNEGLNLGPHGRVDSQTNGSICVASYNNNMAHSTAEKNSADRLLQDQQHGSTTYGLCTDSDFLSLATGGYGVDSSDRIDRTGPGHEALKQFHVPYMQQKNQSAMLLPLPHNGYSSTFPRHPSTAVAQLPPYLSSTLGGLSRVDAIVPGRRLSESDEQQKWMAQIQAQYHPGLIAPYFPDWQNGGRDSSSLHNYSHALYPHFLSSFDSKYKGI